MIVPNKIYSMPLPSRAKCVYGYLCGRANKKGECYPSSKTIASDLSLSERTVFRAISDLEEARLLKRKHRRRSNGGQSSNLYKIRGGTVV